MDFLHSLGGIEPQTSKFVLKRMERQKYVIFLENHWISDLLDMDLIFLDNDVKYYEIW